MSFNCYDKNDTIGWLMIDSDFLGMIGKKTSFVRLVPHLILLEVTSIVWRATLGR